MTVANKITRVVFVAFLNKGGIYHRPEPLSIAAVTMRVVSGQTNLTGARPADARCNYRR